MTRDAKFLIAIPMKDPAAAKTRLATCLNDQDRQELAFALFKRTLDVITQADCGCDVLVVTESARIESVCASRKIAVLREAQSSGLNAACECAAVWATKRSYSKLAILPADLALLAPDDLSKLAAFPLEHGQVALCEATDGGTNCLLVCPPDALQFQYGTNSFKAHRRQAMSNGLQSFVLRDSDMRFDIDTSDDLQYVRDLRRKGRA